MKYFSLLVVFILTACNNQPELHTKQDKEIAKHIQNNKDEARLAQLEYEQLKNKRKNI